MSETQDAKAFAATADTLNCTIRYDQAGAEAALLTLFELAEDQPSYLASACATWADAVGQVIARGREGGHFTFLTLTENGIVNPDSLPGQRHLTWVVRLTVAICNDDKPTVRALLTTVPDDDIGTAMATLLHWSASLIRNVAPGGLQLEQEDQP